ASEDDHVRIEEVDDRGESARHAVLVPAQGGLGLDVAGGGAAGDGGRVERLAAAALVVAGEAGSGEERLHATGLPAVAGRARTLVVGRPRQRVVAPLARDRVGAGPD